MGKIAPDTKPIPTPETLFDLFERTDRGRASRLEPEYAWWNRSAREEVHVMRTELEAWLCRFPKEAASSLVRRFRSTNDKHHRSALLELYFHEHLVRKGYTVRYNPALPGTRRSPDFMAHRSSPGSIIVEVTTAGPSDEEETAQRLKDAAIEIIDSYRSQLYFVNVRVHGEAKAPLPLRRLRFKTHLEGWLLEVEKAFSGSSKRPSNFEFEAKGLRLEVEACMKSSAVASDRVLFGESSQAAFIAEGHPMIERALRKKAGRYGKLGMPYVVAIGVRDFGVAESDVKKALKAVWGTIDKPQYRRVSGVLLAPVVNVAALTTIAPVHVPNPSAEFPLELPFPELIGRLA